MSDRRPDETLYAAERARANLASLRRNDPSIQSITESTTHCTLHQWNEQTERWDKLKQEGAVFVVRRDRRDGVGATEDAVFLLNRSGTKNWALPLEPGEMKVMLDEEGESLTIARRGDRTRRKIWFSEGKDAAKRFEQVLFRICGPPSQRPVSTAPTGDNATPSSKSSSNSASSDLDRLLGNLSMSSGSSPARPRSSTPSSSSRPQSRLNESNPHQSPTPVQHSSRQPSGLGSEPVSNTNLVTNHDSAALAPTHASQALRPSTPPISPPAKPESPLPPGLTADSLLSSILGGSGSPFPPVAAPQNRTPQPHLINDKPTSQSALPHSTAVAVPPAAQTPDHASPPGPSEPGRLSQPPIPGHAAALSPAPPQLPPHAHDLAYLQGGARPDVALLNALDETVAGRGPMGNVGREEFVGNVLRAIHTDQAFVDELWWRYQQRTGGPR